jgi:hypothetical protein
MLLIARQNDHRHIHINTSTGSFMAQQSFNGPDLPGWLSDADGAAGSLFGSSYFCHAPDVTDIISNASFTAPRSSDPSGRVSVANAAAVSSSRRRRLSEHGCGCRSFTQLSSSAQERHVPVSSSSSSTVKLELRAWQQHMRQDVVLQRAVDKPKPALAPPCPGGERKACGTATDGSTAVAQPQPAQHAAVKAACAGGGSAGAGASIHRQLSVLLESAASDGGLPAFAILSIGPSVL